MYDRKFGERELTFEASGALLHSSLVMRDRETSSLWSIMTASAIGGTMGGTLLRKLPVYEKTTWGEWRRRHPKTRVLSVGGREHDLVNTYGSYLSSNDTFDAARVSDMRLPAKEPIFAFVVQGQDYAVPYRRLQGGKLFAIEGVEGRRLYLYRPFGKKLLISTRAFWVDLDPKGREPDRRALLRRLQRGRTDGLEPVAGTDTFWYTWIVLHEETKLLR